MYSSFLLSLLVIILLFKKCKTEEDDLLISFCKDSAEGKWRDEVRDMFGITRVGIAELYCADVKKTDVVMGTLIKGQYEQISKHPDEHINVFLANLLRKMTSSVISTIDTEDELQNVLKKHTNTLVAFIKIQDSIDHEVFQQVALSVETPKDLHIIMTHNSKLMPEVSDDRNMQIWFINDKKWVELEVPAIGGEVTSEEAYFKVISYINNLQYPLIFSYDGDDFIDVYDGSALHFMLVFHTTDQRNKITESMIEPLSKEFQLYFAFILIDCEKFPQMLERFKLAENVTLPLYMTLKNGQKSGVLIESGDVNLFSLEELIKILNVIRKDNPEIMTVDGDYEDGNSTTDGDDNQLPAENKEEQEEHEHSEL